MQTGSILKDINFEHIRYSYRKRGMMQPYPPDEIREDYSLDYYENKNGNLFWNKTVAWNGARLLDGGIDIVFQWHKMSFVDHVFLTLTQYSVFGGIEAYTKKDGVLMKIGKYVLPKDGIQIQQNMQNIRIALGVECDNLTIRIEGAFHNIGISSLDILGAVDVDFNVYPQPADITYTGTGAAFELFGSVKICAKTGDAAFAAKHFCDRLYEKYGILLTESENGRPIFFEQIGEENDGYTVSVCGDCCRVSAGNRRGLLYAAESLLSLSDGETIKEAEISDKPFMQIRGAHFGLPAREQLPFLKKMIRDMLLPLRYNTIFLQLSGAMRYDRFPQINTAWQNAIEKYKNGEWPIPPHYGFIGGDIIEKDEVRELCDFMREYGFEVIPEIQSLSHCQYITLSYPDMAEREYEDSADVDLYGADAKQSDFYKHCLCPLGDKYYDVIFGIIDEVVETVAPQKYVHIGHDEIYYIGLCDKCKKHEAAKLLADEVNALYKYIKAKKLDIMMWSDMLQEKDYKTIPAASMIPKDIVMLDFTWYFHVDEDIEDNILNKDFNVVFGNMYSSHFPRFYDRARKNGILGGEISTWVECDEQSLAYSGKMYDFVYSASCMWDSRYSEDMRLLYNDLTKKRLDEIRMDFGGFIKNPQIQSLDIAARSDGLPYDMIKTNPYAGAVACGLQGREHCVCSCDR